MIGHVMVEGVKTERPIEETDGGTAYRCGTADLRTLKEIPKSYGWLDVNGKTVLDIGAHIGGFSQWARGMGAATIISVEPDECNYALLRKNVPSSKSILSAVVGTKDASGTTKLWYTARGFSHGMNSTQEFQGRYGVDVPAITFQELMEFKPEVIKIDCEGAEYQFLDEHFIPACVRQIAIEIHLTKTEWRTRLAPELIKSFSGWETVVQPVVGESNWATIAGWRR